MLKNTKKIFAIALATMFLATPLMSTASAASHNPPPPPRQAQRHDLHRSSSNRNKAPAHRDSHRYENSKHKPAPAVHHRDRRPAPPPKRSSRHHSNNHLVEGLVIGAVLGAVIANNN